MRAKHVEGERDERANTTQSGGQREVVAEIRCESSSAEWRAAEAAQRGEHWRRERRKRDQLTFAPPANTALRTRQAAVRASRRDPRFVRGCGSARNRGWERQGQACLPFGRSQWASRLSLKHWSFQRLK